MCLRKGKEVVSRERGLRGGGRRGKEEEREKERKRGRKGEGEGGIEGMGE